MKNNLKIKKTGRCIYLCIQKDAFNVKNTQLVIEDRINLFLPWRSRRVMRIDGANAFYSMVPLCPFWHHLLCFTYCRDVVQSKGPAFYQHALILACGGGAVPGWLLEEYPSLTVDIVDQSPEIIAVCKKYFMHKWEESGRLNYYCMDARDYESANHQYQFIFCDLFDGKELAPPVFESTFAQKLRKMISEDGVLVINCGWGHLEEIKSIYQEEFEYVQALNRRPGQTQVIVASCVPFSVKL